ncbi:distal tail protein Dit [Peptoniphilus asaccharolyticus]
MTNAISHCAITFNNHLLDAELKDFMTINVEGRQLISQTLDIRKIPGRDGDVILSGQYPSRDITVHFLIRDKNNFMFLEQIKALTDILHTEDEVKFSFADEDGFRFGRVSKVTDPPYDSNTGIGSFTIHCSDPFLYRELRKTSDSIPYLAHKKYDVKIEEIKVNLVPTKKVVMRNETRGTKIILNDNFTSGTLLIKKDSITVNGQNKMMCLDFVESDYQNFKLFSGDKVSISPRMSFEIKFRERVL